MIKFFRKIRHKLISENRFSKYLIYASGEIILVVIGILIALQINNANELKKQRLEEQTILSGILEDVLETRKQLLETMGEQKRVIAKSSELINIIENENASVDLSKLSSLILGGAFAHFREEVVSGTYDAMIGAGKTSIVQNKKLLKVLSSFYTVFSSAYEDNFKSEALTKMMYEEGREFLYPFGNSGVRTALGLNKKYSDQEKLSALKKMIRNKSFLSYLQERTKWENIRLRTQKDLLNEIHKVLYEFEFEEYVNEFNNRKNLVGFYENPQVGKVDVLLNEDELHVKFLTQNTQPEFRLIYTKDNEYVILDFDVELKFFVSGENKGNLKINLNKMEFILKKTEDSKK